MIGRIGRLTVGELLKLFAQPFLYIALGALLLCTLLSAWVQPLLHGQKETAWRSFHSVQLFSYGFGTGLHIGAYVLLIFASMMFAGEFDRGTIKNLLTRPISRLELFISKCVTVTGLAALLFWFVFFVSAVYALLRGDLGPVWDDSQYYIQRNASEKIGRASCRERV